MLFLEFASLFVRPTIHAKHSLFVHIVTVC